MIGFRLHQPRHRENERPSLQTIKNFPLLLRVCCCRSVRDPLQKEQRTGLLQLPPVGERRLRDRLRLLHPSVRSHEALRPAEHPPHRHLHVHHRRGPSHAQGQKAEGEGERAAALEAANKAAIQEPEETDDEKDDIDDEIIVTHL
jgi:hypothetical protein